jgi:hypothetical protein
MRIHPGREISSEAAWELLAPPARGKSHWREGYSARELARRWLEAVAARGNIPPEIELLLDTHDRTRGFAGVHAYAQVETKLDRFKGSARSHDLLVVGTAGGKRTLLDVEGRVDEPFERTIQQVLDSVKKPESKTARRLAWLAWLSQSLLGSPPSEIGVIRYELLQRIAAMLLRAHHEGAEQAVFVIHELVPLARSHRRRMLKRQAKNAAELEAFVALLSSKSGVARTDSTLAGPFFAAGKHDEPAAPQLPDLPFFIGKATIEV